MKILCVHTCRCVWEERNLRINSQNDANYGSVLIPLNWVLKNGWNGNLMLTNFTTENTFFKKKLLKEE